jgi:hypothetical protein
MEGVDGRAGFDHMADKFMAHNVAGVAGFDAAVEV